jgi:hypothetical protein
MIVPQRLSFRMTSDSYSGLRFQSLHSHPLSQSHDLINLHDLSSLQKIGVTQEDRWVALDYF